MSSKLEIQIQRVKLLGDMVDDELIRYLQYHRKVEAWRKIKPLNFLTEPTHVPKSILKDRMKLLRQEMIELDKML